MQSSQVNHQKERPQAAAGASGGVMQNSGNSEQVAQPLSKVEQLLQKKHYKSWTTEDACLWLEEALKLPQYRKNFQDLALDGIMIDFITDEDLESDLHIKVRLHRVKIMDAIQKLKKSQGQSPKHLQGSANEGALHVQNQGQVQIGAQHQINASSLAADAQNQAQNAQALNSNVANMNQDSHNPFLNNLAAGSAQQMTGQQNQSSRGDAVMNVHGPPMQMAGNSSSPENMASDFQMRGANNIQQRPSQLYPPAGRQMGPDASQQQMQQNQNQNNQFRGGHPGMLAGQQQLPAQSQNFQGGLQNNMNDGTNNNQSRVPQAQFQMAGEHANLHNNNQAHQMAPAQNQPVVRFSQHNPLDGALNQRVNNNQGAAGARSTPPLGSGGQLQQVSNQAISPGNNRVETPPQSQNRAVHMYEEEHHVDGGNRPAGSGAQNVFADGRNNLGPGGGSSLAQDDQQMNMGGNINVIDGNGLYHGVLNDANIQGNSGSGAAAGSGNAVAANNNSSSLRDSDILVLKAVEGQLLNNVYIIGRNGAALGRHSASNDIVISESFVSRRHCEIKYIVSAQQNQALGGNQIAKDSAEARQADESLPHGVAGVDESADLSFQNQPGGQAHIPNAATQSKFYLRDIGSTTGAFIMVRHEILLKENMMFQMGLSEFRIVTTSKKTLIELHVFEGPQRNRMVTVDQQTGLTIGRDMQNSFYVQEDSQMSNFHAKITYCSGQDGSGKQQGFYLQDVGSTNRTWLRLSAEGEVSALHPLKINDIIKIGSTVFVVQSNDTNNIRSHPMLNKYKIQNQNQGGNQGRQNGNGLIAQFYYQEEEKSNSNGGPNGAVANGNMDSANAANNNSQMVNSGMQQVQAHAMMGQHQQLPQSHQVQGQSLGGGFSIVHHHIEQNYLGAGFTNPMITSSSPENDNANNQAHQNDVFGNNIGHFPQNNFGVDNTQMNFQQQNQQVPPEDHPQMQSQGMQPSRMNNGQSQQQPASMLFPQGNASAGGQSAAGYQQHQNSQMNQQQRQQFQGYSGSSGHGQGAGNNNGGQQVQAHQPPAMGNALQGSSGAPNTGAQQMNNNRRNQQYSLPQNQSGANTQGNGGRQGMAGQMAGNQAVSQERRAGMGGSNQSSNMQSANVVNMRQYHGQGDNSGQLQGSSLAPAGQSQQSQVNQAEACKICYAAECNAAFIPCGHNFACVSCAQRCECCPVCRLPFDDIIKIYKQ